MKPFSTFRKNKTKPNNSPISDKEYNSVSSHIKNTHGSEYKASALGRHPKGGIRYQATHGNKTVSGHYTG